MKKKQEYLTIEEMIKDAGAELERARRTMARTINASDKARINRFVNAVKKTKDRTESAAQKTTATKKTTRAKNTSRARAVTNAKPMARSAARNVAKPSAKKRGGNSLMRDTVNGINITTPKKARQSAARIAGNNRGRVKSFVTKTNAIGVKAKDRSLLTRAVDSNGNIEVGIKKVLERYGGYDAMSRVVRQANIRLATLERQASYSPALKHARGMTGGKKFHIDKKMTYEQMKIEYAKATEFLNSETSRVAVSKVWIENMGKKLDITTYQARKLVEEFGDYIIDESGNVITFDSEQLRKELLSLAKGITPEQFSSGLQLYEHYRRTLREKVNNVNRDLADTTKVLTEIDFNKAHGF